MFSRFGEGRRGSVVSLCVRSVCVCVRWWRTAPVGPARRARFSRAAAAAAAPARAAGGRTLSACATRHSPSPPLLGCGVCTLCCARAGRRRAFRGEHDVSCDHVVNLAPARPAGRAVVEVAIRKHVCVCSCARSRRCGRLRVRPREAVGGSVCVGGRATPGGRGCSRACGWARAAAHAPPDLPPSQRGKAGGRVPLLRVRACVHTGNAGRRGAACTHSVCVCVCARRSPSLPRRRIGRTCVCVVSGHLVLGLASGLEAFSREPPCDSVGALAARQTPETRGTAWEFLSYYPILPSRYLRDPFTISVFVRCCCCRRRPPRAAKHARWVDRGPRTAPIRCARIVSFSQFPAK